MNQLIITHAQTYQIMGQSGTALFVVDAKTCLRKQSEGYKKTRRTPIHIANP